MIKAMLKINEGLELGGVREPLPALIESDMAIVEEAAKWYVMQKRKVFIGNSKGNKRVC